MRDWLSAKGFSASETAMTPIAEAFLSEMQVGLDQSGAGSLQMIPSRLSVTGDIPLQQTVAVIDAGGTNLRVRLAGFDLDGGFSTETILETDMPGRGVEVSSAVFFDLIADALAPHADTFQAIGFCFSYPTEIRPDGEGVLVGWTKEIKMPDLVGKPIIKGLKASLAGKGIGDKQVVLLNDTVATLLAGVSLGGGFQASSYIGVVLGTGLNAAYIEQNQNIGKLEPPSVSGSQIINIESGGFDQFGRTEFDVTLDEASNDPGTYWFEKTVSGAYLGALTQVVIEAWQSDGGALNEVPQTFSTRHVNEQALRHNDSKDAVTEAFKVVTQRTAKHVAAKLAAIVEKSGQGTDADKPVCICIDGTTYYAVVDLRTSVEQHLRALLDKKGLHTRLVRVDEAPVVGAAIAALGLVPEPVL